MIDYRFYELTYSLEGIDEQHFWNCYEAAWRAATCNVKLSKGWKRAIKCYTAARKEARKC